MIGNYDFLLFENFYRAINHNKDVDIIAKFLKKLNYTVAILDVCPINNYRFEMGLPVLKTKHQYNPIKGRVRFIPSRVANILDDLRWNWHLHKVLKEYKGKYKHLYVGSYYTKMIPFWFFDIPKTSSVFFWGLRSFWLQEYKYGVSLRGINSFFLSRMVKHCKNLKFFVSDDNIKSEFIDLGISPNRLVLRYERYIDEMPPVRNVLNNKCSFLSIGSLRREKRIEMIVSAFDGISEPYRYYIAGRAEGDYDKVIQNAINGNPNIVRNGNRLTEEEFNDLMDNSDYLVLCDVRPPSCVTNGTMNEALLKGIPIIAPNYNPYMSVIEKYHVGIMFDPNIEGSLHEALEKAARTSSRSFRNGIEKYQQTLLFDRVLSAFNQDIKLSLS